MAVMRLADKILVHQVLPAEITADVSACAAPDWMSWLRAGRDRWLGQVTVRSLAGTGPLRDLALHKRPSGPGVQCR